MVDANVAHGVIVAREACGPFWQVAAWPDTLDADFPKLLTEEERRDRSQTIVIPNTVAIVRGADLQPARRLVDWLLSEETEAKLAASGSRQVPVRPAAQPLPAEVEALRDEMDDAIDLSGLLPARREVLEFLTQRAAGATP